MLIQLAMKLTEISPRFKRFLWKRWYQHLAGYQASDWKFMNYGYCPLDEEPPLELSQEDEPNRYAIQLYHHVASSTPLKGLDVLEVGCGRGGGASFVARYHQPRSLLGVDYSSKVIEVCKQTHHVPGLSFLPGDAESLPAKDASFDAVLNVESSHCYRSVPAFFAEVKRVLRPGGHFLFADLRSTPDCAKLHQHVLDSGMQIVEREEITPRVLEALRRDSERKRTLIEQAISPRLAHTFREFAAIEGSEIYRGFRDGGATYVRYLLRR